MDREEAKKDYKLSLINKIENNKKLVNGDRKK